MNRQDIINDIALYLEKQNQNNNTNIDLPLVVEELNIWGQYTIGYEGNRFGIFVGKDNFWGFEELSDEEIEMIYESL